MKNEVKVKGQEKSELKVFIIQSNLGKYRLSVEKWGESWESGEESGGGWGSGLRSNYVAQIGMTERRNYLWFPVEFLGSNKFIHILRMPKT